jgi:hypothetical protein
LGVAAFAATDKIKTCTVNATVDNIFSIEWETDSANVAYPNGGPVGFSTVDPASTLNYADNHSTLKADIALICKSNENVAWGLKTSTAGSLPGASLLYYMAQPTVYSESSGKGELTSGTLANSTPGLNQPWPVIPQGSVIYTAGDDTVNTPYGTYCGLSLGIHGGGLSKGNYSSTITFTMTQSL